MLIVALVYGDGWFFDRAAAADHTFEGGDGYVSGEGAGGEQHQRLHGGGGCSADDARSPRDGQAHP